MKHNKKIKRIRKILGISQPDFAEYLGVSDSLVKKWEQDQRICRPFYVELAEFKFGSYLKTGGYFNVGND